MSRELRLFLVALVGVLMVFVGVSALLPEGWTVQSSQTMPADKERVVAMFADFNGWKRWSPIASTGRSDTEIFVEGEPGQVGHQLRWISGPSEALLRLERVGVDGVDYQFLSRINPEEEMQPYGQGQILVTSEGDGSRVTWRENGTVGGYLHRWFVWFGAQQKTQQQFQEASLTNLLFELESEGDSNASQAKE